MKNYLNLDGYSLGGRNESKSKTLWAIDHGPSDPYNIANIIWVYYMGSQYGTIVFVPNDNFSGGGNVSVPERVIILKI